MSSITVWRGPWGGGGGGGHLIANGRTVGARVENVGSARDAGRMRTSPGISAAGGVGVSDMGGCILKQLARLPSKHFGKGALRERMGGC